MRNLGLPLLLAALALAAAGCGDDASSSGSEVSAVATTTQVADLVGEVGGGRVAVERILEPNSDPHSYEPRPSDAAAIAATDVVFRSGGDLDEWLGDLIENAGGEAPTVDLFDSVEVHEGEDHEGEDHAEDGHDHGDEDPHWWQDPHNAIAAVAAIEAALIETDPDGKERYRTNARAYTARLRRLDRSVGECIAQIPARQRRLVTTHDALGYYAERYGLTVVGALIPSQSTAAQPSAGDIEALVDQIEQLDVKALFPESSLDPKLEQAVARETGADVGRALWADTLGEPGSSGETYVGSIQSNTEAIVDGLTDGAERCRPTT
jgi:ABC-type Zn uptake system ZnuABC Zn-binding protein ZnuA